MSASQRALRPGILSDLRPPPGRFARGNPSPTCSTNPPHLSQAIVHTPPPAKVVTGLWSRRPVMRTCLASMTGLGQQALSGLTQDRAGSAVGRVEDGTSALHPDNPQIQWEQSGRWRGLVLFCVVDRLLSSPSPSIPYTDPGTSLLAVDRLLSSPSIPYTDPGTSLLAFPLPPGGGRVLARSWVAHSGVAGVAFQVVAIGHLFSTDFLSTPSSGQLLPLHMDIVDQAFWFPTLPSSNPFSMLGQICQLALLKELECHSA